MKRCHRPEWSDECTDYCDCDNISNIDMNQLWEEVCPDCKWFYDVDDMLELTSHDG